MPDRQLHLCLDVHYLGGMASVAGIVFPEWTSDAVLQEISFHRPTPSPYEPGQFFRRELPCLLEAIDFLTDRPDTVLIDGYVWLGMDAKGLGAHLYEALSERIPVIGVAKTKYEKAVDAVEVLRGTSLRPLYITSAGLNPDTAAEIIRTMHGANRLPTLLKRVDSIARGHTTTPNQSNEFEV